MKKNRIKSMVMVGVIAVCFGLAMPARVMAYNTMTVSPPTQKMVLIPGETYNNSIDVSNASNSDRDLKYEVKVGSFSQGKSEEHNDDYGSIDLISRSSYNQIVDWIELGKESGTVAPGETEKIPYTINVPEDAPAGGQYATIVVVDKTTSDSGTGGNISISDEYQFASVIFAEVAGETRREGEILENKMPSFLLNGALEATSMVRNNGNVHTDAEYVFQVWPIFSDEEVCTNEENPDTSLILPGTERYHAQKCDLPSVGIFKAKQVVKIFGEESTLEKIIIVCPIWLLFIIFFLIAAIIIWIIMRVRGRSKRAERKSENV